MGLDRVRRTLRGADRDLYDPGTFRQVTVGALAAWVVLGGDLLGSCVYGPDALARAGAGAGALLVAAGMATALTMVLLAAAYDRMVVSFPHGGGGYTAARTILPTRVALVSGVALALDAALNIAVSIVTCVEAARELVPASWGGASLPAALALILLLVAANVRGIKDSVALLAPIIAFFAVTHLCTLGVGLASRTSELPALGQTIASETRGLASRMGATGLAVLLLGVYAQSGAMYTGLESISNGVPLLREPRPRTARWTMWLLAGIPTLIIVALIAAYLLFDVQPEPGRLANSVLFARISHTMGPGLGPILATSCTLSEVALLIVAAQAGFSYGPRILGALAADRFVPRRFARLNGRLAPSGGILAMAAAAIAATLLAWGALAPLLTAFVVTVFVTFTISQVAMLRLSMRRTPSGGVLHPGTRSWAGAALHIVALVACLVILVGTIATSRDAGAFGALGAIGIATGLGLVVRSRYAAIDRAAAPPDAALPPGARSGERRPPPGAPVALVLVGDHVDLGRLALEWLERSRTSLAGIVVASVAAVDTELARDEHDLRALEERRRGEIERLAARAAELGYPVEVLVRRGADVAATAAGIVRELLRERPGSAVIGFRARARGARFDRILVDEVVTRIEKVLGRQGVTMNVLAADRSET